MLTIRRDGFNGQRNDHYRARKRRMPAKQWRSLIEREYADSPRVDVQGVSCGIRRTFEADRPFRLIQPTEDGFRLLDVWAQADGTLHVRQQCNKEVLAVFVETDDGLAVYSPAEEATALTPYEAAAARHQAIDRLLATPLPPAERERVLTERKAVQRELSRASIDELYQHGLKAFRDGSADRGLIGRVLKVLALENQSLRTGLTPAEQQWITEDLLPTSRRAVATYVKYRRRMGQEL